MASTEKAWTRVREAYMASADVRADARALGKLARTHGLTLRELQARIRREGWRKAAEQERTRQNLATSAQWMADGLETARRELAALAPRLAVDVNDPKAIRAFAESAYRAGNALSQLYGVAAWYVETRHDATKAAAWRPWPSGFPKMPPAPWRREPKRTR